MKKTIAVFVTLLILSTSLAFAGDLVGEWKTMDSWGARAGKTEHGLGEGDVWTETKGKRFTLKITDQSNDGRAFHGEWCGPEKCEDLVGAVKSDGTLLMADEDGYFEGKLMGSTLELCYSEAEAGLRIVSCRTMEKK